MKYITDYPHLCDSCQETIRQVASMIREAPDEYASDPEGPIMLVYDRQMYCGGFECKETADEEEMEYGLDWSYDKPRWMICEIIHEKDDNTILPLATSFDYWPTVELDEVIKDRPGWWQKSRHNPTLGFIGGYYNLRRSEGGIITAVPYDDPFAEGSPGYDMLFNWGTASFVLPYAIDHFDWGF